MTQATRLVLLAVLAALPVASARADATAQTVNPPVKNSTSPPVVCHASGVANAPKLGDRQVWAPYAARGADALLATVLTGRAPCRRALLGGRGDPARGRGVHAKLGADPAQARTPRRRLSGGA